MKYILVILMFFASQVLAFHPNDLINAEIKAVGECQPLVCAVVEKNNKQYIIRGELDSEGNMTPVEIYTVEGKKLRQLWSITWRDT